MTKVVDLASHRRGARIAIEPTCGGFRVRIDPPANRPGVRGGEFPTFGEARRYALAMKTLLSPRPVVIDWAGGTQNGLTDDPGPAAA